MRASKIVILMVKCLNPYSNGTMYLIRNTFQCLTLNEVSLNPYSNGTMYLIYNNASNDCNSGS